MPLKTDVFLRRAGREDLDTLVAWMDRPDFAHFLYGDPARSPKQIREQIVSMLGRTTSNTLPGAVYLMIDSKAYGLIGLMSIQNLSWRNRSCTIDLYIGNLALRNRAIAPIAAFRAAAYCFDELNLHRVATYIYAFNTASWRLLEKAGAVRELTLREHVARDGQLHDVYAYGLLESEFRAFRKKFGVAFDHTDIDMHKKVSLQDSAADSSGEAPR